MVDKEGRVLLSSQRMGDMADAMQYLEKNPKMTVKLI